MGCSSCGARAGRKVLFLRPVIGQYAVTDQQFARGLGIADGHIVAVQALLKVRATPTVLIVNRQGRILGAWEGVAKADQQAAMNQAVDALALAR